MRTWFGARRRLVFDCRIWALHRLPGLNADEAWLSVQVIDFLLGNPYSLYTPTGNPMNPFLALPVLVREFLVADASVLNLRLPAAIAGVLLMALAYPLTRKAAGDQRALVFTLLVWVMPAHIVYARMGWPSSETPLVGLMCLASFLHGRTSWMALCAVAAVWVHPTNVFLVPILAGGVAGQVLLDGRRLDAREWAWVALALLAIGAFFAWRLSSATSFPRGSPDFFSSDFFSNFLIHGGRFISGATSFQFVVGPISSRVLLLFDLVFWAVLLSLLVTGLPRRIRARDGTFIGLLLGTLAALISVTVSGGLQFLVPGFERYALFLTVPSCFLFASLLVRPGVEGAVAEGVGASAALVLALIGSFVWLGVFVAQYHVYWTYWPMRYLGARDPRIEVEEFDAESPRELTGPDYASHAIFAVGFSKDAMSRSIERGRRVRDWGRPVWKRTFNDPENQPILDVWRLR